MASNIFQKFFIKKGSAHPVVVHIKNTYYIMVDNLSLFLGVVLSVTSLVSFSHGRECDGTTATYYACTNPDVYYYYTIPATFFLVVGVVSIVFWFVKRDTFERMK
jgi:hypothetical protein